MRKLKIDGPLFHMAFDRDVDYEAYPQFTYLDLGTGEIFWVYEDNEDAYSDGGILASENQAIRELIESSPSRYLEIPGFSHGDHHDILGKFLDLDWTEDEKIKNNARDAYFGSIGGWRNSVPEDDLPPKN